MVRLIVLALLIAGICIAPDTSAAQIPAPPQTAARAENTARTNARLGITFINSVDVNNSQARYQNAQALGASWTRWPLYWSRVEPSPGTFNWAAYDQLVIADLQHNLRPVAVLLDYPGFYAEGVIMQGLYNGVFSDGSDTPGPGKVINPNNPWANFVSRAVQRYRPNGILAQQRGFGPGEGVRIWEIWNEPDLPQFWRGSSADYARLLKVAYLATKQADPQAVIMFGGLLFNTPENWLASTLQLYAADPLARQQNYFMDAVALHSYVDPRRTGWLTRVVRRTLNEYGLSRPIYVTESGISAWDDYPGPLWADASLRAQRGTLNQQAWFFIQSTAYAWANGADVVFYHQLFDDCGDQPPGTDFPPHGGQLCSGNGLCFGDAFGIYRNASSSVCYSQHPDPGSARPIAAAYRLLAQAVPGAAFTDRAVLRNNEQGTTEIRLRQENNGTVVRIIWNRQFSLQNIPLEALGSGATLHTLYNTARLVTPQNGTYTLSLPPAQPDDYPYLDGDLSAIGGEPLILVETVRGQPATLIENPIAPIVVSTVAAPAPLAATPGPIARPTVAPEADTQPPITSMPALPENSEASFVVRWQGRDDGQIVRYIVWVQVNEGEWQPWLETARTESIYTGTAGNRYAFAVWAVDAAGNWSRNTQLSTQAQTRIP